MSACGGSSSGGDDGGSSTSDAPTTPEMVPGGTPDSPVEMSLELKNELSSDTYYNYFTYKAKKGDTIFIHTILENSPQWCTGPAGSGAAYIRSPEGAVVAYSCFSKELSYTFQADGTYLYHANQGSDGYFEAAVTHDNPVVSDLYGTYKVVFVPADNSPGGCSVGIGIMVISDYGSSVSARVSGTINDVNTGEEITTWGHVTADGFVDASLDFSFGSEGSMSGLVLTSGKGEGTWDDTSGCFGDWRVIKY